MAVTGIVQAMDDLVELIRDGRDASRGPDTDERLDGAERLVDEIRALQQTQKEFKSALAAASARANQRAKWLKALASVRGPLKDTAKQLEIRIREALDKGCLKGANADLLLELAAGVCTSERLRLRILAAESSIGRGPREREALRAENSQRRQLLAAKAEDLARRERLLEERRESSGRVLIEAQRRSSLAPLLQ